MRRSTTCLTAVHAVFEEKGQLARAQGLQEGRQQVAGWIAGRGELHDRRTRRPPMPKYNLVAGTSWFFASPQMRDAPVDVLVIDEAGQLALADAVAASDSARNVILLGDPLQLAQVSKATHPDGAGASVLEHMLGDEVTISAAARVFLAETRGMHPAICDFISAQFYEGRLTSHAECSIQRIDGVDPGLVWIEAHHDGRSTESPEEARIGGCRHPRICSDGSGPMPTGSAPRDCSATSWWWPPTTTRCTWCETVLRRDERTAGVKVGTVDKFQGGEAPVVFFTMATSTGDDMPRGPEFLFSRNRLNVAVSRAQYLAVSVCNEELLDSRARSVEDMRLIGTLGAFVEAAWRS